MWRRRRRWCHMIVMSCDIIRSSHSLKPLPHFHQFDFIWIRPTVHADSNRVLTEPSRTLVDGGVDVRLNGKTILSQTSFKIHLQKKRGTIRNKHTIKEWSERLTFLIRKWRRSWRAGQADDSHHFADERSDVVQIVGEFFADLAKEMDGLGERADGVSDPHWAVHRL